MQCIDLRIAVHLVTNPGFAQMHVVLLMTVDRVNLLCW